MVMLKLEQDILRSEKRNTVRISRRTVECGGRKRRTFDSSCASSSADKRGESGGEDEGEGDAFRIRGDWELGVS